MCCLGCEHVVFEMSKVPGVEKRLFGTCRIYGTSDRKIKGCNDYPQYPDRLLGRFCGYRFIDEKGQDITTYRKNPILFTFTQPSIWIIRHEKAGVENGDDALLQSNRQA